MSQKKVDAYKKAKANRAEIIKKEKRILMLEKLAGLLVCVLAVVWIGFSVYSKATSNADADTTVKETVLDTTALDDYAAGITEDAEDTEAEAETGDAEAEAADAE